MDQEVFGESKKTVAFEENIPVASINVNYSQTLSKKDSNLLSKKDSIVLNKKDSILTHKKNNSPPKTKFNVKFDYSKQLSDNSVDLDRNRFDKNIEEHWQEACDLYSSINQLNDPFQSIIINKKEQQEFILNYLRQKNIFAFNDIYEDHIKSTIKTQNVSKVESDYNKSCTDI